MLSRNENNRLIFDRLRFEVLIVDILENAKVSTIEELEWVIDSMLGSIDDAAYEYSTDENLGEWEGL